MKRLNNLQVILVSVVLTGIFSFSSATAFADEYFIEWKQNFGGNGHDEFTSAKAVNMSNSYVAVGYSAFDSFGNGDWTGVTGKGGFDAIIVKYGRRNIQLDSVMWKKHFGGSGNDFFQSVTVVPDGYVAVGYSEFDSFGNGDWTDVTGHGSRDAIIVKFDPDGNVVWKKNFGGSSNDSYYSVIAVSDGVIASGQSANGSFGNGDWTGVEAKGIQDAIIVKYDHDGNVVWKKNFGGSSYDMFSWVTEVPDGFIAVGHSFEGSFGNGDWTGVSGKGADDAIIVKYDSNGNVVWKKNFGGSSCDYFNSVTAVSDGVIVVGESCSDSFGNGDWTDVSGKGGRDAIMVKYDFDGNVLWKKNFGGNGEDYFWTSTAVSDGIVVVGASDSNSFNTGDWTGIMGKGGSDALLVKYDYDGNILWRGNFGGSGSDLFIWVAESVKTNTFTILGYTSEDSFGTGDWTGVEGKGDFDATIIEFTPIMPPIFIPVTNITNVPVKTKFGDPLILSGKVVPGNATYQLFSSWELKDAGTTGATISNGNILNTTNIGAVVVTATIENGAGIGENFTKDFIIAVNPEGFFSVTNIINVPTVTTVKIPLALTGTVVPSNATNQTIVWNVKDAGTTGATITGGNILNTITIGTVIVTATINAGIGPSVDFTKDFIIAVNPVGFISVTDIINVPQFTIVETPLTLTGTVAPSNATNKTIIWSMKNAGGTGATISPAGGGGWTLNPTKIAGKVVVTATITNGTGIGIDFVKDFTIAINPEDFITVTDIIDLPTSAIAKTPLTLTGTVVPDNATNKNIAWSIQDKGTTNATITGDTFKSSITGVAIVRATINNGIGIGVPFIKEFEITVEQPPVGIVETHGSASSIQVYPNPTSGELRIEMCDMRYEICDIQIFDVMGRKVSSFEFRVSSSETLNYPPLAGAGGGSKPETFKPETPKPETPKPETPKPETPKPETPKPETMINISDLPSGIYFLRIQTENGVVVRKVVKN